MFRIYLLTMLVAVPQALFFPAARLSGAERPNFLIIMADDLGFSDIGCYGSEIETPHLDRLASRGLRFSQFYNTAKCHSSRISLLTGQYAFQAGNTALSRAVTSAEVLRQAGYSTAMVGKWHLNRMPTDFGFERYFGHLSGACNYFTGDKTFRLNGEPWQVPAKDFYTTVANVDFALRFLNEARATEQPWHLYVAFNAPHAPLQPLEVDYKKYLGRYDIGWDAIRDARLKKQAELGLFDGEIRASERPAHIPAWETLNAERKSWESRRMAAYAGLIDRVDQEIGRLIADLERRGELDNTFVLFVSDNGACPYDRRHVGVDREPYRADTTWSDSTGWAWARNAPFRFYKQNQFEGGVATPGIVHWPAGLKTGPGAIVHEPLHLVDVLPTLAELGRASLPLEWPGRELGPVSGVSFARVLAGEPLGPRPPIHFLFSTDRGLRDGDWKLVSFRGGAWELYHLPTDRAEVNNVAADHPEVVERLAKTWHEMAERVLRAPEKSRTPVGPAAAKTHREWTDFSRAPGERGRKAPPAARGAGPAPGPAPAPKNDRKNPRPNGAANFPLQVHVTVGKDRKALAGLTVVAGSGPNYATFVRRARTNAQGVASFELPANHYRFSFRSDLEIPYVNLTRHQTVGEDRRASMAVNLPAAAEIVFKAIDVDSGRGVAGVQFDRSNYGGEIWEHLLTPDNLGHVVDKTGAAYQTGDDGLFRCLVSPRADYYSYSVRTAPKDYKLVENRYVNPLRRREANRPGPYEIIFQFRKIGD